MDLTQLVKKIQPRLEEAAASEGGLMIAFSSERRESRGMLGFLFVILHKGLFVSLAGFTNDYRPFAITSKTIAATPDNTDFWDGCLSMVATLNEMAETDLIVKLEEYGLTPLVRILDGSIVSAANSRGAWDELRERLRLITAPPNGFRAIPDLDLAKFIVSCVQRHGMESETESAFGQTA